jgi:hypothetical protein
MEAPMPIKPELRWFYPIDWPQISRHVRFERAGGRCQGCGRFSFWVGYTGLSRGGGPRGERVGKSAIALYIGLSASDGRVAERSKALP